MNCACRCKYNCKIKNTTEGIILLFYLIQNYGDAVVLHHGYINIYKINPQNIATNTSTYRRDRQQSAHRAVSSVLVCPGTHTAFVR